ncbi:MAG: hypothetical protein FWE36_04530 [Erysipelotrichales bacterium]|nr:hypothetical protein [Erysipelotrichales bacterium]
MRNEFISNPSLVLLSDNYLSEKLGNRFAKNLLVKTEYNNSDINALIEKRKESELYG